MTSSLTDNTSTRRIVRDVMTRNPVCVGMGTTIKELAELLVENEFSGTPVIDSQGRAVGVVSKTDLLRRCLEGTGDGRAKSIFVTLAEGMQLDVDIDADELGTVEEFMTIDPVTTGPGDDVHEVALRMSEEKIHRVIVVDENQHVLGIVTSLDLLKALAR